ncbi:putative Histone-like DNA-binding protein [Candidatus Xenohaliotis californiensis]|uniref:Histone-like DNA-binding protein n=1 Tax=Candidatus Xenohaliotis californiensis TaxID=84677 RepID=A0ABM9N7Z0_9RICK|nr:putative Histone-like DNA-binding protein [Candidatus Xenohaliotis californiensis]
MNNLFVQKIAEKIFLDDELINEMLKIFFYEMTKILKSDKKISLHDFGVFSVKLHKSYTTINPSTLKNMDVESYFKTYFKPSCKLLQDINYSSICHFSCES